MGIEIDYKLAVRIMEKLMNYDDIDWGRGQKEKSFDLKNMIEDLDRCININK